MEMVIMLPPGADFFQPVVRHATVAAEFAFDAGVDEDPIHFRQGGGGFQHFDMGGGKMGGVDGVATPQHRWRAEVFALADRQAALVGLRRQQEPDVHIQAGLVATVAA